MKRSYSIKTTEDYIQELENRFKIVSTLNWDLSRFPMKKQNGLDFQTDKNKSREFAEVFTPLYIVDEMIQTIPVGGLTMTTTDLDLCAGYGQFSIRMIRKLHKDNANFNLDNYLRHYHFFNELQISSCYKLLWIFGSKINLAIGDALELGKLPGKAKGIWYYLKPVDSWVNVTELVKRLFLKYKNGTAYNVTKEKQFVKAFNSIINRLQYTCEEYEMCIKKIISTKEGRQRLLSVINDASDGIEVNWQENDTPEWVVREMVNTIPDLNKLKKILVLFNIEFLECLIREKKINPKKIDFGYDSELEGLYASSVYKVGTFSLGKNLEELKESTKGKVGYDVVFSNPPYQEQSDSQKKREGGGSIQAKPLYHKIAEYAIDSLNPKYLCMITPSRWMVGGMGLNKFRKRMLQDKRLRLIQDFPGERTVFPKVQITGGVNYFLWDRDYNDLCEFNGIQRDIGEFDVLVRDNTAHQILKKVLSKTTAFCNKKVLPNKPFGLPTNFNDWIPEGAPAVKVYTKHKKIQYCEVDSFTDKSSVAGKWKSCCPRAAGGHQLPDKKGYKNILMNLFIVEPMAICTETYIVIRAFNTKKEAENYLNFVKTKFYRLMLSLRVVSQDINREKFSWVPDMQDYTRTYTDQELYQHFGLTKKEIEHIEKTIKALD